MPMMTHLAGMDALSLGGESIRGLPALISRTGARGAGAGGRGSKAKGATAPVGRRSLLLCLNTLCMHTRVRSHSLTHPGALSRVCVCVLADTHRRPLCHRHAL